MYMYVRMCISVYVCAYVCMCVCMYVCMYVYAYTYVCMHVRMCMYVCVCVYVCMYVWVYVNIYEYIHTHTYVPQRHIPFLHIHNCTVFHDMSCRPTRLNCKKMSVKKLYLVFLVIAIKQNHSENVFN